MKFTDTLLHRWLAIPYALHANVRPATSKKAPTILFLHGIGNTGDAWNDVIKQLPPDLHLITIDLLGFGNSQRPSWVRYSAKTQARSVMATFFKLRITGRVIIVGHSLGSLVAVEIAKRYPILVKSLILCSPPFYRVDATKFPNSDSALRTIYKFAKAHPEHVLKLAALSIKYGLVNKSFSLAEDGIEPYLDALESTIINQTSLKDAEALDTPMTIIRGRFDPVIVAGNLRRLERHNKYATLKSINAGHEIIAPVFIRTVVGSIMEATHPERVTAAPKRLRTVKNLAKSKE